MRAFWIVAVGSVATISLISVVVGWWFCGLDAALFGGIVGGLITAVATLALIWVGIKQLQELAKTAKADFALRRADQFFQPRTRTLFHLVEDGYLRFEEKTPFRDSYFMVDDRKLTESHLHADLKNRLLARRAYSTYEIDDLLLGPFEDIAWLEDRLSFDVIYQFFGYYICRVWENGEIKRYVRGARTERKEAADIYKNSESLAERCAIRERSEGG